MTERPRIVCGNCKQHHSSVAEVKACYVKPAPVAPTYGNPATEKQEKFLRDLAAERVSGWANPEMAIRGILNDKRATSRAIDWLLEQPKKTQPPVSAPAPSTPFLPAGRYAVHGNGAQPIRFFRVDRPTSGQWAGRVFASELFGAPGAFRKERRSVAQVAALVEAEGGTKVAAKLFADETDTCSACGSPLTDAESRRIGMGPVCRSKGL